MIRLLLVRHGETDWNKKGLFQGQSDIELNTYGLEQVRMVGQRLSTEEISSVYSSDLKRAKQTTQAITSINGNQGLPVTYTRQLRELYFGDFEGKNFEEIKEHYLPLAKAWRDGDLDTTAPGGETLSQLGTRIMALADGIYDQHTDETVLVVAHGGPLQLMMCYLIGIDIQHWWRFHLDTASISIVNLYKEWSVLSLMNGTAHLATCSRKDCNDLQHTKKPRSIIESEVEGETN
ncbi:MAG: histidine phosphatase family protein [Chloroflexota bacterium]|nr:histidine phosphatase family protein [Chloroflexota bacterium]